MQLVRTIVLFVFLGILFWFGLLNSELVTLKFYVKSIELPLSILMFSAFAVGLSIGICCNIFTRISLWTTRHKLSKLKHKQVLE